MQNVTLSAIALLLFTACGEGEKHDPPQTIDWEPECEGTLDAESCITLTVSSTSSARSGAPGDMIGTLFWALYKEGDVDMVAGPLPGVTPVYSGEIENVDVSEDGRTHLIHIAGATVQKYHPLLQLDDDLTGAPNDGDVVTLPQAAFNARAGEHIKRNVALDHICGTFAAGECDP